MSPGEERVDLVDLENRVVGRALRREVRSRNLLHRGVGIVCFDGKGRIYVHRRTETKDIFPGMYDMFVGGVVASGESYRAAAAREVAEELGIVGPRPDYLFSHLYLGDRNRAWIQVYRVEWDGPIRHQPEEVSWGSWIEEADLEGMIRERSFVPDGLEIYHHYQDWRDPLRGHGLPEIPELP